MASEPLLTTWDGSGFVVATRHAKRADETYVVGTQYFIEPVEPRSMNSHRHYFATLTEAWRNLPEDQAERWPTPDHLRRYALIMSGWREERTIVAESKAAALRMAAFVRPMDEYAVVTVRDAVVRVWTAKSQSLKAMGKADFAKSKNDVLGYVANMIGVGRDALSENAGKSA